MGEKGDYMLVKAAVKEAVKATFDAMIEQGVEVALLALVSHGTYAGPFNPQITREYKGIVTELLEEKGEGGEQRGKYFDRVIVAGIDIPSPEEARAIDGERRRRAQEKKEELILVVVPLLWKRAKLPAAAAAVQEVAVAVEVEVAHVTWFSFARLLRPPPLRVTAASQFSPSSRPPQTAS